MPADSTPREGLREALCKALETVNGSRWSALANAAGVAPYVEHEAMRDNTMRVVDVLLPAAPPAVAGELSAEMVDRAHNVAWDAVARDFNRGRMAEELNRYLALARSSGERDENIEWVWACEWCEWESVYISEADRDAHIEQMRHHSASCPKHPAVIALRALEASGADREAEARDIERKAVLGFIQHCVRRDGVPLFRTEEHEIAHTLACAYLDKVLPLPAPRHPSVRVSDITIHYDASKPGWPWCVGPGRHSSLQSLLRYANISPTDAELRALLALALPTPTSENTP